MLKLNGEKGEMNLRDYVNNINNIPLYFIFLLFMGAGQFMGKTL